MTETRDIHTLLDDAELMGVTFSEVSARRPRGVANFNQPLPSEVSPTHGLTIGFREDRRAFRIGISTELEVTDGEVAIEVIAEYELEQILVDEFSDDVMLDFVNRVAVMTLAPYIREAIASVTQRVFGSALTMPVIRPGDINFGQLSNEAPS